MFAAQAAKEITLFDASSASKRCRGRSKLRGKKPVEETGYIAIALLKA